MLMIARQATRSAQAWSVGKEHCTTLWGYHLTKTAQNGGAVGTPPDQKTPKWMCTANNLAHGKSDSVLY